MTLEAFAQAHSLPPCWLELRRRCEDVVRRPDFWYRTDLRQEASDLAIKASNILEMTFSETARQERDHAEEPNSSHTLPTEMPI